MGTNDSGSRRGKKSLSYSMLGCEWRMLSKFVRDEDFCVCVICHRVVYKPKTELLFTENKVEVRVCAWCNHA